MMLSIHKQQRDIILLYGIMVISNIVLQLATDTLISLDSWTIYHVVASIVEQQEILPRAVLYSYYPLSYLPLIPAAWLMGTLTALKFFYPFISSAFVIPLYFISTLYLSRGRFTTTLTIALISDFFLRSVAVTPQGIALVFFCSAVYWLKKEKKSLFLLASAALILTHHLTSLVLVLWISAYLLQKLYRTSEQKFTHQVQKLFRQEKTAIAALGLFVLDWGIVSYMSGKNIVSAFLLIKLLPAIVIFCTLLFLTKKQQIGLLKKLQSLPEKYTGVAVLTALALFFVFIFRFSTHSFLSTHGLSSLFFISVYIAAPILGLYTLLQQENRTDLLFFLLLGSMFTIIIALRLNCIFDAYRLLPFALIPLIIMVNVKSRTWGYLLLILSILTLIMHGSANAKRLTYTRAETEAAQYAHDHLTIGTVATDTKLSALFLGVARLPATFEGSYWLFTQSDLAPWIKTFNQYRFQTHPIRYIALSQSMLEKGADISWSSIYQTISPQQVTHFDQVGRRIYSNNEVTIWQVDEEKILNAPELAIETPSPSLAENIATIISGKKAPEEPAGEPTINPEQAYGSTCGN